MIFLSRTINSRPLITLSVGEFIITPLPPSTSPHHPPQPTGGTNENDVTAFCRARAGGREKVVGGEFIDSHLRFCGEMQAEEEERGLR